MATDSRRLSILTVQEIDDLYGLPRFMEEERHLYFDMSPAERNLVDDVHTISVAVHLILQIGYFKAKRQFFIYAREAVTGDLEHILRRYFPARDIAEIKVLSKPTRLEQQQVILNLFDYQLCDAAAKSELEQKAQRVAMLSTQPIFILREALQYLTNQRIVVPGYTYLQDMVGRRFPANASESPYAIFYVRHRTEDRRNETDNLPSIPIAAAGQESSESRLRCEHFASREPIARRWREEYGRHP